MQNCRLKSWQARNIMRPVPTGFFRRAATLALVLSTLSLVTESTFGQALQPSLSSKTNATAQDTALHHYEYVFPDGNIYVYDLDNGFKLVKHISVPTSAGVRGS